MLAFLRRDRAVVAIVVAFILLVGGMVGYNAWATDRERPTALVVDVTARQRTLVERYVKDVVLRLDGVQADPEPSAKILSDTADALLSGGKVVTPAGEPRPDRVDPRRSQRRGAAQARARTHADPRAAPRRAPRCSPPAGRAPPLRRISSSCGSSAPSCPASPATPRARSPRRASRRWRTSCGWRSCSERSPWCWHSVWACCCGTRRATTVAALPLARAQLDRSHHGPRRARDRAVPEPVLGTRPRVRRRRASSERS